MADKKWQTFLLLLLFTNSTIGVKNILSQKNESLSLVINENNGYVNQVNDADKYLQFNGFLHKFEKSSFRYLRKSITTKCFEDLLYLVDYKSVNHTSYSPAWKWQQQMLDSYGNLPAGIVEGNLVWMGDFNQCIMVDVWKNKMDLVNRAPDFQGKYCVPNINHYIPGDLYPGYDFMNTLFFTFGVCFPSTCTVTDVEQVINDRIHASQLRMVVRENECQTKQWNKLDNITIMGLIVLGTLLTLVILGTAYEAISLIIDWFNKYEKLVNKEEFFSKFLTSFSAYKNTKEILDTRSAANDISCINGIRFFLMIMVINAHVLLATITSNGTHNKTEIFTIHNKLQFQVFNQGILLLDAFFFISAFLMTHSEMEKSIRNQRLNIISFYKHRLFRLVPTMAVIAIIAVGPNLLLNNGPLWRNTFIYNTDYCKKNFWQIPLFFGIYHGDGMQNISCAPHTWYLDVEMFYFIMSPIILYPLIKKESIAPIILMFMVLCSFIVRWNIEHEEIKNMRSSSDNILLLQRASAEFMNIHIKPWYRPQSFLIGMLFGYFYNTKKRDLQKLLKSAKYWMLPIVTVGMLHCIFQDEYIEKPLTIFYHTLNFTFSASFWSICIGCIIMTCATGNGGIINTFLSWKVFLPIGKVSFSTYLIHVAVLNQFAGSKKEAIYVDMKLLSFVMISINLVAIISGGMLSLLIELPARKLERLYQRKGHK